MFQTCLVSPQAAPAIAGCHCCCCCKQPGCCWCCSFCQRYIAAAADAASAASAGASDADAVDAATAGSTTAAGSAVAGAAAAATRELVAWQSPQHAASCCMNIHIPVMSPAGAAAAPASLTCDAGDDGHGADGHHHTGGGAPAAGQHLAAAAAGAVG